MNRVHRRADDGASLILVLIFVLVLSVVLSAVASYASTSLRATSVLREIRNQNNALDGAVNGAVQTVRRDLTQGRAPGFTNGSSVCTDFHAPTTSGVDVTVSCGGEQNVQGQYDSGASSPINNPNNKPSEALFATARAPERGIVLDANGIFRVHGGVYANSTVEVTNPNGELKVEGDVKANGSCSGLITSLGPPYPPGTSQAVQCNSSDLLAPEAYPAAVSTPPATVAAPSCPAGYLVTVNPGTYKSAAALSALTSASCSGKIVWFKPGVYLFDFTVGATHEWTVKDATSNIVGGTPFGWDPTAPTRPVIPRADQANPAVHSCITDEDALPLGADPNSLGVQFVFTGDSHWTIDPAGGNVELCAQPGASSQQIAIYGVPRIAGNEASGSLTPTATGAPDDFAAATGGKGLVIDGVSSAPISFTAPSTSTLTKTTTVTGFDQLTSATLPDTAQIEKVTLTVAHNESPNNAVSVVTALVTGADGVAGQALSVPGCTTLCTSPALDVTRYLGTVAKLRSAAGARPKVTYSVTALKNKTVSAASTDGFRLDVTWVPKPLVANAGTAAAFIPVSGALTPDDGALATATVAANTTQAITLAGYNQLSVSDVPPGASITKVLARVVHQDDANAQSVSLNGKDATGATFTAVPMTACQTSLLECTEYVDLTGALGTDAKLRSSSNGTPTGPTLTYTVRQKNSGAGTYKLDGIQLIVVYGPGGLGSASGCVVAKPYSSSDSSTCALLQAKANGSPGVFSKAYIAVHGTIYAPAGAFDLKVMNGGTTVFGRGAVVRTLQLFFNPSVTYTGDNVTVRTPDESLGVIHRQRVVDFWACVGAVSPCNDANAKLHAVAAFTDDPSPGAVVDVRSWARRR